MKGYLEIRKDETIAPEKTCFQRFVSELPQRFDG